MKAAFGSRGKKSAGVGLQYCGTTGRVENCQVGVFLSSVKAKGHTLIDANSIYPWTGVSIVIAVEPQVSTSIGALPNETRTGGTDDQTHPAGPDSHFLGRG
jgi:hypothetical protein